VSWRVRWSLHGDARSWPQESNMPVTIDRMFAALLAIFWAVQAHAQGVRSDTAADYPNKPIRIVIGFTPGGGPDITARYLAQKLTETWKQQVVVDNRPGAGGTLGANIVARANPDGYTLLSVSPAHAVAHAIYPRLPYDTLKDFAGISVSALSRYLLVVAPTLGVKSVAELIAMAKAKPGQLNFSSAGVGSASHFTAEIFKSMAAIDVVHVPFKGIPEALTEAATGRVQFFMSPIASAIGLVKDGKLQALGVSTAKRDPLAPNVPTIAESGLPGFESNLWFGLLTSSSVPRAVRDKINRETVRILSEAETRTRWLPIGLEPSGSTPEAFDKLIAADVAVFTKIARAANIRAN
jgi:tripartite-type tricarboxylate transporter receptor subunit TctC